MSKKKTKIEGEEAHPNGAPVATTDAAEATPPAADHVPEQEPMPAPETAPPPVAESLPLPSELPPLPEPPAAPVAETPPSAPPLLPDPPPVEAALPPVPTLPAMAEPVAPPTPPVAAPAPAYEPSLVAPVAQVAPLPAPLVITAPDPALEERLRRLEALLSQAQQNLHAAEQQRVSERTQIGGPPEGPSMLSQARTLIDVGRRLLPSLPGGDPPPKPRGWLVWELIAEFRAIFCMYLDPRYRLPWYGYVLPPALLAAYVSSLYWVPFALALKEVKLHWLLTIPVELILLYCMFKILGYEARRYRETAPDLPPSLRINPEERRQS